ncbi:PKD domain-containing protein [Candidatus Pacearchaeota archaeon]|nr:PKD domain-containing protein [Candidatus Pacearchaeota archaeon]
MKKITLSLMTVLVLVLGISLVSFASAAISGVNFVTPATNANISGDSYLINWTNTVGHPGLYLQEKEGGCESGNPWATLIGSFNETVKTYSWDTSSKSDGVYCLRLYDTDNESLSGNFTIDNTNPVATLAAGEPYMCNEGSNVTLDASNSFDNETGIALYEWDVDNDGSYDDGTGVTKNFTCPSGPALQTVKVRVKDYAGNSDEASSSVNISNVAPVCNGINAFTDYAVGEPTNLYENASDVVDSLQYNWDFDDGNNDVGNPANYTFTSAGVYNVSVVVNDGTESCVDSLEITVVNPMILPAQEVMALENLDANFTPYEGSVANSFATNLTGGVSCNERIEVSGMDVSGNADDCVVTWNNVPNNESGINLMVVRVDNGTDYEYYSFNTTVWSWKIDLVPGWNLVSIPVVPKDSSIENVFLNDLENSLVDGPEYAVWSYQYDSSTSSNRWFKSRKNGDGDLDTVEPGKAYWLNLSNADTLKGYGDKLIAASTPPETVVIPGWNLIGHYGLLNILGENALQDSLSGCYSTILDSNGNTLNKSGDNFNPGKGYWVGINTSIGKIYFPSSNAYNFN